ncbi:MAG: universal stress protein [Desulfobacterales bacterium]|nr:universal stress protein [Desulfobacterales bacterium]
MFEKILFATTGTPICDHAAHVAFDLTKKYKSHLTLFHTLGTPSHGFSQVVKDLRTGMEEYVNDDYVDWVREEIKTYYTKQLEEAEGAEIDAAVGFPHREILRIARKADIDLIIMGAHAREEDAGATRYRNVVGSTMQRVAKGAKCPVLIVSRPCTTCLWYFSNIVFGTDFSKASMSAFKFAFQLAREIGAKIHLFHALDMSAIHAGKAISQDDIEKEIKAASARIEKTYVSQMGDYDNYAIEVWEGVPYVEILKYTRENNGDLVVMAHHTREVAPEDAQLGSTVEQVVLRAACPVASVNRPDKVG